MVDASPLLPDGLDRERFLSEIWQRRPLLMRGALSDTPSPLTPDELAGLACDPDVESRIVMQESNGDWNIRHGPFDADYFATLPASDWTLLVQDVDKWVPSVQALMDGFDFVPTWRIDDIMVSYAADGGGVGPHTDAYDVFLIQLHGRRRWRLSFGVYGEDDLVPGIEQRILRHFETDVDWTLEPGDILYLPPGVAHWGKACGDCMTYSLGFRSPDQQELVADWLQELVECAGSRRLADPVDIAGSHPAEIGPSVVNSARSLVNDIVMDSADAFPAWIGRYLTEPKPQFQVEPPASPWDDARLETALQTKRNLQRHPWARLAWSRSGAGGCNLFCNGAHLEVATKDYDGTARLTQSRVLTAGALETLARDAELRRAVVWLVNEGAWADPEQ